jgi:DNA-binding NarL/FixJ family response regulator
MPRPVSPGGVVEDQSRIRVLIVDDHSVVRMGLRVFFDLQDDIEVVGEAADGSEGVAMARRLEPDVILMDLLMPNMDGITAAGSRPIDPRRRSSR